MSLKGVKCYLLMNNTSYLRAVFSSLNLLKHTLKSILIYSIFLTLFKINKCTNVHEQIINIFYQVI